MRALLLSTAALVALAGCSAKGGDPNRQVGANPQLPEQNQYLLPPMKIAPPDKWKAGETPIAAPGLKVAALATGLSHPRRPYVLPNGDILIVESSGPPAPVNRPKEIIMGWVQGHAGAGEAGKSVMRITLLRDTNGDGKPELRTTFLDHLSSPFGVALIGPYLYVANTDAIIRYPYVTGQTRITAPGVKFIDLPGGPIDHHWTKDLAVSPDGSKLYASVGSNSNITENGIGAELDRACIWEIDVATGAHRIYASGLRNPNGLSWNPDTHQLWAVVNERDELGPDLVPDYMTSVRDGGFYGWPWSYYGRHVDPRVRPQRPDMVARAIVPDYALSSHVAPLGMTFVSGGAMGAYQNGAFVGEHGSWDRGHLNGYKVVFVPFANGRPAGPARDVLTGFISPNGKAHGRPVGVAMDRTGALLVADDLGNTVWRVSGGGAPAVAAAARTTPQG